MKWINLFVKGNAVSEKVVKKVVPRERVGLLA